MWAAGMDRRPRILRHEPCGYQRHAPSVAATVTKIVGSSDRLSDPVDEHQPGEQLARLFPDADYQAERPVLDAGLEPMPTPMGRVFR